jgi:hypothetical protein
MLFVNESYSLNEAETDTIEIMDFSKYHYGTKFSIILFERKKDC